MRTQTQLRSPHAQLQVLQPHAPVAVTVQFLEEALACGQGRRRVSGAGVQSPHDSITTSPSPPAPGGAGTRRTHPPPPCTGRSSPRWTACCGRGRRGAAAQPATGRAGGPPAAGPAPAPPARTAADPARRGAQSWRTAAGAAARAPPQCAAGGAPVKAWGRSEGRAGAPQVRRPHGMNSGAGAGRPKGPREEGREGDVTRRGDGRRRMRGTVACITRRSRRRCRCSQSAPWAAQEQPGRLLCVACPQTPAARRDAAGGRHGRTRRRAGAAPRASAAPHQLRSPPLQPPALRVQP